MSASATQGGHNNLSHACTLRFYAFNVTYVHTEFAITQQERIKDLGRGGSSGSLRMEVPPLGSRGKAPLGGLGTSPPEAGDILQIILQRCNVEELKTVGLFVFLAL